MWLPPERRLLRRRNCYEWWRTGSRRRRLKETRRRERWRRQWRRLIQTPSSRVLQGPSLKTLCFFQRPVLDRQYTTCRIWVAKMSTSLEQSLVLKKTLLNPNLSSATRIPTTRTLFTVISETEAVFIYEFIADVVMNDVIFM